MHPVWAVHCPKNVYENPRASGGDVEVYWHTSSDIHRLHASNGTFQQIVQRASLLNSVPAQEHRVYNQQQEVVSRANPRNGIPWDDNKLSENGHKSSRQEDQEHQARNMENSVTPVLQLAPSLS